MDPAQIPPIRKEHSKPFMEDSEFNFLRLQLTEIMRQKGEHPIVDASMVLRENLKSKNPLINLESNLNENEDGVIVIDKVEERSKVREILKEYYTSKKYKDDVDYVKTIAWRNVTIRSLNKIIRGYLFPDSDAMFNVGERLIANSPLFEGYSSKGRDGYKIKNSTSDEFLVTHVTTEQKYFMKEYFKGKFWQLSVEFNGQFKFLQFIHEDSAEAYEELLEEAKARAISTKNVQNWIRYYDILKWSDDIVYNYAITAHKSQGSSYDNVVLIEEDIDKNWNIVERNRIKYTAYTRAKHKLFILK